MVAGISACGGVNRLNLECRAIVVDVEYDTRGDSVLIDFEPLIEGVPARGPDRVVSNIATVCVVGERLPELVSKTVSVVGQSACIVGQERHLDAASVALAETSLAHSCHDIELVIETLLGILRGEDKGFSLGSRSLLE